MPRTTFYGNTNVQAAIQPNIGLDATTRQSVIDMLNLVLADEAVLSKKTRLMDGHAGAPDLQSLYVVQSTQLRALSDEIAERIRILGGDPLSDSEAMADFARLDGKLAVAPGGIGILADQESLIRFLRGDAQKCSEAFEDQGTSAMLIRVMCLHEKMAWQLRSEIAPRPSDDEKQRD